MRNWKAVGAGVAGASAIAGALAMASGASAAKTLYSATLFGNIPNVTVRGVASGVAPWIVKGTATVTATSIVVKGTELVVPPGFMATGKPVAKGLVGTTVGVPAVAAELSCGQGTKVMTKAAPLSKKGAFSIDSTVKVPTACADPIILVGPLVKGKMFAWFASTNFLTYGLPGKSVMGWGGPPAKSSGSPAKSTWA